MEHPPVPQQSSRVQLPGPRKRNRFPVSCGHCRLRKQKCNRASPCEACVKSGDASTCSYVSYGPRDDVQTASSGSTEDALIARIDHLEQLMMSVITNANQNLPSGTNKTLKSSTLTERPVEEPGSVIKASKNYDMAEDPETDQLAGALGIMHIDPCQSKTIYLGGAHWLSVMCQIEDFKSYLLQNREELERKALEHRKMLAEVGGGGDSISLLHGTAVPLSRDELLSSLLARDVVEELLTQYFETYHVNSPFIHEPTFRKECINHWEDPKNANIVWLGLLFAILRLAELSFIEAKEKPMADSHGNSHALQEYKKKTIQCLIAADYTNPITYTIETLLLYIGAEWRISQDADIEISLVLGIAIRLAMRMGIHRDSRVHAGITAFRGEMRRRVWAVLHEMDILYSFQLSLPTTIRRSDYDCGLPRNLSDDDLKEDMKELPPPRISTEVTPVSYTISKYRFTLLLGDIIVLTESRECINQNDILKYESAMYEAREAMPHHLRISTDEVTNAMDAFLVKQRIGVDRIYQLAQCILHRKSLTYMREDTNSPRLRRLCIDAAITLLNYQATIFLDLNSTYPQNFEKRHLSTLSTHDFFIAGMAIALDLHHGYELEPLTHSTRDIALWGYDRRAEMTTALGTSIQFWRICKDYSVEAGKAYGIFSFVLMGAKKAQWIVDSHQTAAARLPAVLNDTSVGDQPPVEPSSNHDMMIDETSGFDWNLWIGDFSVDNTEDFESLLNWSPGQSPDGNHIPPDTAEPS